MPYSHENKIYTSIHVYSYIYISTLHFPNSQQKCNLYIHDNVHLSKKFDVPQHTNTHSCCIQTSGDVVVLSNALFVVSAILPMVPSYIGGHLHDIFTIFCELATIRTTNRLGKTGGEKIILK